MHDLYLRALARSYRFTEQGFAEAVVVARQALSIDPSYAPAAALVGWCRTVQRVQGWGALSDQDVADAVRLARQALEPVRDDPDTMWRAAHPLFILAGEAAAGEAILDRALTLNPNAASAWMVSGWIHALRNEPGAAIKACERALRLSPLDPLQYMNACGFAMAHLVTGRFEQAIEWADRTLRDQPRVITAIRIKVVANAHLGLIVEARAELARMLALNPKFTIAAMRALLTPFSAPEFLELYISGLRLAGLPE
jgi:adenylate cyclase